MKLNNVADIKQAVDKGLTVYHGNPLYEVQKDCLGQYLIVCTSNGYAIGLTWRDSITLNGLIKDFKLKRG